MKTLRFFIPTLALLGLFATTSCDQIEEVLPPPQTKTTVYKGTNHEPLGNATLTTSGEGTARTLKVSNLGSSGEDGVGIDLTAKKGIDLYFDPIKVPDGGYMEFGAYASGQNTAHSGLRISGDSGQQKVEVFFEGQDKVTVEGFRDGELVFRQEEFDGSRWLWLIPVAIYVLDHTDAHYTQNSDGSSSWGVSWNGSSNSTGGGNGTYPKATVEVGNKSYRGIDLLKVTSAPTNGTPATAAVRIKTNKLPAFTIVDETVK